MKILVIDDHPDSLNLIQTLLSPVATCVVADNGAEGLRLFEAAQAHDPFHLIFLDIMMPNMDGHEVLVRLRALEKEKFAHQPAVRIAMLTAAGNSKNRFTSFKEGCDYYVDKPIIKNELLDIVQRTREWFALLYNKQT